MPISQLFLYLHFLKVRPFFIKDAKNHGNRLNHSCRKTRFKNISNAHINRFGPPQRGPSLFWTTEKDNNNNNSLLRA